MPHEKEIYHASAVQYNEALAEAAEAQAELVEDPEVKKWCRSVGKQHRFHAKRHKSALVKAQREGSKEESEDIPVAPTSKAGDVDYRDAETGQFVTEEYAAENPATTVAEAEVSGKEEEN